MFHVQSQQRRSWGIGSGVGAVILSIFVALVTGQIAVLLVALVAAGLTAALWVQPSMAQPEQIAPARAALLEPARPQIVTAADGTPHAAFALDEAADAAGYRTVLTRAGYVVVDDAGKIVYTLKR